MTILEAGRVQAMMVTLYKCLHGIGPALPRAYLKAYIQKRRVSCVSDYNILSVLIM